MINSYEVENKSIILRWKEDLSQFISFHLNVYVLFIWKRMNTTSYRNDVIQNRRESGVYYEDEHVIKNRRFSF